MRGNWRGAVMFSTDEEDGDFLSPTGGAKLASLFGMDQAASQGNDSFQYTAPKQPKKSPASTGPQGGKPAGPLGAPAVLLATAVHAFQYVNGQYVKQGKLGAAVLGNHVTREYKILLYVSQQKQVTSARIHPGFVLTVQPSNYGTFYDDQRQNWSLMFESEKAAVDFCKQVCLAKANGAPSLDSVVTQDLVLGEGQRVENGDSLEVAYTGWLLQNQAVGQMFDSNLNKEKLLRLKLGSGKVIKGWEEGMLGMRKGGQRLLVVPPALAYGSQGVPNRVPANSTLVFETEIRRVKFAKDSGLDRVSAGSRDSAVPSPAPSSDGAGPDVPAQPPAPATKHGELPLRAKSNSLNEQLLQNPDTTKAKLISRMARMGQPMLPFLTGPMSSQLDSSDSEMEDPSGSRFRDHPPAPSPQPVRISAMPPTSTHGVTAPSASVLPVAMTTANPQPGLQGSVHAFQPYSYNQPPVVTSQLQPVSQVYASQTVPYQAPSDITSFLMTEARQHNTEIRLAVGKVADKVDQLASKVDDLQKQGGVSRGLSNVSMETAMIMHNIQRIIQENECLKKEVFEKSSRIEEQNRKIGELINQNQRYMEQSNLMMEQRNDSMKSSSEHSQARMLQAEQDKVRLTEELASSTARVSQLQLEASSHQQKATELQAQLSAALQDGEKHCTRLAALESQVEELTKQAEQALSQHRLEKQKRREAELKLSNLEEELQDLRAEKESLDRALVDRKKKWQAERQRCDDELEEVRRSALQEAETLRAQLRKARTSTDQAAAEQLAQLQAELQVEWQARCDQALASAREQHGRERVELQEQRDALEQKLAVLQEKVSALKLSRESEEHQLLQQQSQGEELQALRAKYTALQEQSGAVKERLESRVADLERRVAEQSPSDTVEEVKRVMNGVFHSLRGEFDLQETYRGSVVLGVIVSTIKRVTLQLLTRSESESSQKSENDGEEEEEVGTRGGSSLQEVQPNGNEEVEEKQKQVPQEEEEGVELKSEVSHQEKVEVAAEEKLEVKVDPESQEVSTTETTLAPPTVEDRPKTTAENHIQPLSSNPEAETKAEVVEPGVEDEGPLGDPEVTVSALGGPPARPPPPPNALQDDTVISTSLSEEVQEENGAEPFFRNVAPTKPPPLPAEDDEDELSLKGQPPPAPLFADDDDDDDLDWLG